MADSELIFALAKGRLSAKMLELLISAGIDCAGISEENRSLVQYDGSGKFKFIFVKPSDVPTYVERGAADIGVAGKDTIMEEDKDIFEMLDLGFGHCTLCIAGYESKIAAVTNHNLRVATKYVNIANNLYMERKANVDIIKLSGSIELAPVVGMSDIILDIVESGKTLAANNLAVLEKICDISARLVVNKASLKTKTEIILPIIKRLEQLVV